VLPPRITPPYSPKTIAFRPSEMAATPRAQAANCTPCPPMPLSITERSTIGHTPVIVSGTVFQKVASHEPASTVKVEQPHCGIDGHWPESDAPQAPIQRDSPPVCPGWKARVKRLLDLVMDGLRAGAPSAH